MLLQQDLSAVGALLAWGVANLFVLGLTAWLGRWLRLGSPRSDVLVFGFLYLFLVTAWMMLFGLAGWLRPGPVLITSLLGGTFLAVAHRRAAAAAARRLVRVRPGRPRPADLLLGVLILAVAARTAIHIWYLPPYVWDTLTYHLPNVAEWVQQGRLTVFDTPIDRTFWPANFLLLETWFVLFPRHDFLVEAAAVPYFVLACAAVASLGRSLGLGRRTAVWAGLLYGLTPLPLIHAATSNNDLPIAAAYLALLALLADGREKGWPRPRRLVLVLAMILCLAVGTKPYILFLGPGLAVAALWALRWRPWRVVKPLLRGTAADRVPALAAGAVLGLGLLLAGYWFARNQLLFDNPLYPAEPRFAQRYLFEDDARGPLRQGAVASAEALRVNLRQLARRKIWDRGPFYHSVYGMTGWGWVAFCCGGPGLLLGLALDARLRWLALAFTLSLLTLLACVVADPWNMRFTLWFPALPVLAFVWVASSIRFGPLRRALHGVALTAGLLNVVATLGTGVLTPAAWRHMASLDVMERSAARVGPWVSLDCNYVYPLARIPADEPIAYTTYFNGWVYPLYDSDLSRRIRWVPIDADTDVPAALAEHGARHLFVCRPPSDTVARLRESVAAGELRPLGGGLYAVAE